MKEATAIEDETSSIVGLIQEYCFALKADRLKYLCLMISMKTQS